MSYEDDKDQAEFLPTIKGVHAQMVGAINGNRVQKSFVPTSMRLGYLDVP